MVRRAPILLHRETAREAFRLAALNALDEAARDLFARRPANARMHVTDSDLPELFRVLDPLLERMAKRYGYTLTDDAPPPAPPFRPEDGPFYVWSRPAGADVWQIRGETFATWADAEGAADALRLGGHLKRWKHAVSYGQRSPDRLPHVVTDEGWTGPLWAFLEDNADSMDSDMGPDERAEIALAILRGETVGGGGGAAAEWTVAPADKLS